MTFLSRLGIRKQKYDPLKNKDDAYVPKARPRGNPVQSSAPASHSSPLGGPASLAFPVSGETDTDSLAGDMPRPFGLGSRPSDFAKSLDALSKDLLLPGVTSAEIQMHLAQNMGELQVQLNAYVQDSRAALAGESDDASVDVDTKDVQIAMKTLVKEMQAWGESLESYRDGLANAVDPEQYRPEDRKMVQQCLKFKLARAQYQLELAKALGPRPNQNQSDFDKAIADKQKTVLKLQNYLANQDKLGIRFKSFGRLRRENQLSKLQLNSQGAASLTVDRGLYDSSTLKDLFMGVGAKDLGPTPDDTPFEVTGTPAGRARARAMSAKGARKNKYIALKLRKVKPDHEKLATNLARKLATSKLSENEIKTRTDRLKETRYVPGRQGEPQTVSLSKDLTNLLTGVDIAALQAAYQGIKKEPPQVLLYLKTQMIITALKEGIGLTQTDCDLLQGVLGTIQARLDKCQSSKELKALLKDVNKTLDSVDYFKPLQAIEKRESRKEKRAWLDLTTAGVGSTVAVADAGVQVASITAEGFAWEAAADASLIAGEVAIAGLALGLGLGVLGTVARFQHSKEIGKAGRAVKAYSANIRALETQGGFKLGYYADYKLGVGWGAGILSGLGKMFTLGFGSFSQRKARAKDRQKFIDSCKVHVRKEINKLEKNPNSLSADEMRALNAKILQISFLEKQLDSAEKYRRLRRKSKYISSMAGLAFGSIFLPPLLFAAGGVGLAYIYRNRKDAKKANQKLDVYEDKRHKASSDFNYNTIIDKFMGGENMGDALFLSAALAAVDGADQQSIPMLLDLMNAKHRTDDFKTYFLPRDPADTKPYSAKFRTNSGGGGTRVVGLRHAQPGDKAEPGHILIGRVFLDIEPYSGYGSCTFSYDPEQRKIVLGNNDGDEALSEAQTKVIQDSLSQTFHTTLSDDTLLDMDLTPKHGDTYPVKDLMSSFVVAQRLHRGS